MAVDLERLVARLEADITRYERSMSKATSVMDRSTKQMDGKLKGMQKTIDGGLSRSAQNLVRQFEQMGGRGGQAVGFLAGNLGRMGLAAGVAAGAIGGTAVAAFSLAKAAEPFVKMQNALKGAGLQGDELRATFDALFAIAQRQGVPVEGLVTLYSRLAVVQKDLGATQGNLLAVTEGVGAALKLQGTDAQAASGALLQLSQAFGGGVVRAEEFNSILEGMPRLAQAAADNILQAGGSVAKLRTLVTEGEVSSKAFFDAIKQGSRDLVDQASKMDTLGAALTRSSNAWGRFFGVLNEATGASSVVIGALDGITSGVDRLTSSIQPAIDGLAELLKQSGVAFEYKSLRPATPAKDDAPNFTTGGGFGRLGDMPVSGPVFPPSRPKNLIDLKANEYKVPGKGRSGGGGGGAGSKSSAERTNDFERELEQSRKRIAATEQETASIGKSAFEADRAKTAFELMEAAKQAGLKSTPELTAKINAQAEAEARANEVRNAALETQQRMVEMQQFVGQSISGFFSDIVSGGRNAEEALMNLVKRLADVVLQAALLGDGPLGSFLGGGKGGLIGSLFSAFGGARAAGGPVSAGKAYLVGEKGPELMVPGRSGMVIPNSALARAGGGASITVVQNIAAGVSYRDLAAAMGATRQAAMAGVQDALARGRIR
jgi:tape measure domain-containing protein